MEVCRKHGGKSLRGAAHPHWKGGTGRHRPLGAKLPAHLRDQFDGALSDPDLIEIRTGLAYAYAFSSDLEGRLATGESGEAWRRLGEEWAALKAAQAAEDRDGAAAALKSIGQIISGGLKDDAARREIMQLQGQRAALARAELDIIAKRVGVVTPEEFMATVELIHTIIAKHVTDRKVLNSIGIDLGRLLLGQAGEKRQAVAAEITGGTGPVVDVAVVAKDQPVAADQQQPAD